MHSLNIPNRRRILHIAAGGVVAAMMAFTQQPLANAQTGNPALKSSSGAQGGSSGSSTRRVLTAIPDDFANLKLAPGFLLNIDVYGEPELSGNVRIDNDGNITFPFLGTMHVSGDTVPQAQEKVQKRFRDQEILTNPQITINVEQFAATSVMVLGEVQVPGRVELLVPHALLDVIGMAGGETALAGKVIEVKHSDASPGNTYQYSRNSNGETIRSVMVRPGDTVIVKRAGVVYVLGAVNRPGGYVMQEDGELNVVQAISLAQGLAMQAKTSGLRVVKHGEDGQVTEIPVSYKRMTEGKEAPMQLNAEDIVYCPVSKTKAVLSAGTSFAGQVTAATIYAVK
jgi:polysaccharide biosynthesis/export protein